MHFPAVQSVTRYAARALVLALAGCAAGSSVPHQKLPDPTLAVFDGRYAGTSTPDPAYPDCGTEARSIRIEILGGRAWIPARHARNPVEGRIDTEGQLAMQDPDGRHLVTGTVQGNRLQAVETMNRKGRQSRTLDGGFSSCSSSIDAARGAPAALGNAADPD